ncbi:MAG: pyrroloquinoline quinone biosynthesis peptide chaperone PqqD [Gammaproteobacteria bacterium]|nr:pyrroloquinoline quinone biosynthesis peptide chaperone PqqD [Gammaproteobacteria bacterium]
MSEPTITPETIARISPMFRLQWEEAQDCHVLLYPEGMVKLSASAGEILKRIDGKTSLSALITALKLQFPGVPLDHDVTHFVETAYGQGWLRSVADE